MKPQGPWGDRWLRHPCPMAFEPQKEGCRLTRQNPAEDEAQNPALMEGYAFASLGAVDRFFMKVRYALNPLDRARATGQRHGRRGGPQPMGDDKWDVYHPYNPAHVQTHCVAPDAVVPLVAVIGAGGTAVLLYNHPAFTIVPVILYAAELERNPHPRPGVLQ